MKKGNVVDLIMYRNQRDAHTHHTQKNSSMMSEELTQAIQNLIHRLRELGPIKQSN